MTDNNVHQFPLRAGVAIPDREDRDWVTTDELITDTGISYRQADYWTRTGLLVPLDGPNPGSGNRRRYHTDQVARAAALYDLLAAGFNLYACRQVIDEFVTEGHATIGCLTITRQDAS